MFLKYTKAMIREWVLWIFFGLDVIGLFVVYAPMIGGGHPLLHIPPAIFWLLPVIGVYWAGYRVYAAARELPDPAKTYRIRDREVLDELRAVMPPSGSIRWLRDYDFGSAFNTNWLKDLHRFIEKLDDPNVEFIDSELEKLKSNLHRKCTELIQTIGRETEAVKSAGKDGLIIRIPYEMSYEDPERFQHIRARLNDLADETVKAYDELIKQARRKL